MEQKTQLEIGDYIYEHTRRYGLTRYQVERVSPKQAFAGTKKVYRELTTETIGKGQSKAVVKQIGAYGNMYIETPELKEEYETKEIIEKAIRLMQNATRLSKEQALQIITILSSETKTI